MQVEKVISDIADCMKIAVIGCGHISVQNLTNLAKSDNAKIVACSDIQIDKARSRSIQYNTPQALSTEGIFSNDSIDIILNLTTPNNHSEISIAALNSGKHVYNEKPLSIMNFEKAAIGTIMTSPDIWDANLPKIEIYGTKGVLFCSRPQQVRR